VAQRIRKDDLVIVIAGKNKRQQGRVKKVLVDEQRVIVEGVNLRKKHVKPSQENQQGGVIEIEMPIHVSNVAPVVNGMPTRVRYEIREDGSKVRIAKRDGSQLGEPIRKARKPQQETAQETPSEG
jgi:large subunit ribosomal protein L24